MAVVQNLNTEIETVNREQLDELIKRPIPRPRQRNINEESVSERLLNDEDNRLTSIDQTKEPGLKRNNSLVVKRNQKKVTIVKHKQVKF